MTTPRITRTGALRADLAVVDAYDEKGLLVATLFPLAEEMEAARSLHGQHVRVTIEPADATPEEAPHGSPLDYLAEAKRLLESDHFSAYVDGRGEEFQNSDGCKRLLSLLNSTHLAALNYLRRQP